MTGDEWHDDTWSKDWWRRHWLGMTGLLILAFYLGCERGDTNGEARMRARIAEEHPAIARKMAHADAVVDSTNEYNSPPADEQWDNVKGSH